MAELINFERMTIQLQSGTLADSYTIDHLTGDPIGTSYSGTLYGWPWGCTVRTRSVNPANTRVQLSGDYDISRMLTKYITFSTASTDSETVMGEIAAQLGKTLNFNADSHGCRRMSVQTSVMQVLSQLYGWTSATPNAFVNVFLRGDTLHVVQRGKESATYAPQNYNILGIQEKLIDTLMDECLWQPSIIGDPDGTFLNGTEHCGTASITYVNGFVVSQTDGDKTTTFTYCADNPNDPEDPDNIDKYLTSKTVSQTGKDPIVTSYSYEMYLGELFLRAEVETQTINFMAMMAGYTGSWFAGPQAAASTKYTTHAPLGNGFFSSETWTQTNQLHVQYVPPNDFAIAPGWYPADGYSSAMTLGPLVYTGGTVSEGRPGGRTSPHERGGEENTPKVNITHNPIAPAHIPVTDTVTLSAYAANLETLDEKTQVTMKVDCYDQAIVDFDKTVTLGGNVWFLNANQISVDAKTGIRQSLELVRWA